MESPPLPNTKRQALKDIQLYVLGCAEFTEKIEKHFGLSSPFGEFPPTIWINGKGSVEVWYAGRKFVAALKEV